MNDERSGPSAASERRLREWFAAAPAPDEPASLRVFLATVPEAHPRRADVRMWPHRPRLFFVAAALALLVGASVLVVVGSHVLESTPAPSLLPSVAPASPSLAPSPSAGALAIGPATRIGGHVGTGASLAATTGRPLVSISSAALGAAANICPPSAIGAIGSDSIDWTTAQGAVLELAGDPSAKAAAGLGVSSDCSAATVGTLDEAGGFAFDTAPNPLRPDAAFFAHKPGDPKLLAAWDADQLKGKGGFISWSTDGGVSWQSDTDARPLGWDATGIFWSIGADGRLARSQGPGFSSKQSGIVLDVATTSDGQAADIAAGAVFRDRILVAPKAGGLDSVATSGSTVPERRLDLRVLDISTNSRYVAVMGLDVTTGRPMLAISTDGRSFTSSPPPLTFGTGNGGSVRVLALDDRVLLTDGGQDGVVGIWAVPLSGVPAAPSEPTPAPTPVIPTPPPAEKTSTWTPVTLPSLPQTPSGGPGGGLSALPGGGFIDFVPIATRKTAVLTSPDGTTWKETGEVTGSDATGIGGLVAFDGKRYVALGYEGGGQYYGGQSNGAAWVSTDLRHWTKAPIQDAFAGAEFGGIAAGPDGFVAIGFDNGGQSVWRSSDGLHWTSITDDRAFPADSTEPTGIAYTSRGFLMVGRIDQEAATWTSVNGQTWKSHSPLAGGSGVVLTGLAEGQTGFISLGSGGSPIEVAPNDDRYPVTPWTSADGETWHAGSPSPALFGAFASIVSAPGGYIAVGTVGPNLDGYIWSSRDGRDWVPVAGVDLSGLGSAQLVSDGRHVLLSASTDTGGSVLLVSDGIDP